MSEDFDKALIMAIKNNNLRKVYRLIKLRPEYYAKHSDYALEWVAENNHIKLLELLIKKANTCANGEYALTLAAKNGHCEIVEMLVKAKVYIHNNYAINAALKNGHDDVVKILTKAGAKIKLASY